MTRVLSALVMLPVVLGVIWLLPPSGTLVLALLVVVLAVREFTTMAEQRERTLPATLPAALAACACVSLGLPGVPVEVPLLAALVVIGAVSVGGAHPEEDVVRRAAVALMPALYIGLPVGALVAIRTEHGPAVLLVVMFTVMASDVAQYYGGRTFGRRLLAPIVSPKKTVEGAVSGVLAASMVLPAFGAFWLPGVPAWVLAGLGLIVALLGIVGDLFESLMKRSAGVKDTSALIPGHGGVLDRIDSLLFVAPVYYAFLRYWAR